MYEIYYFFRVLLEIFRKNIHSYPIFWKKILGEIWRFWMVQFPRLKRRVEW
jgi:hypothetical protein